MLKVYGFKKVNKIACGNTRDLRVLWALDEMQIPFEVVGMDHPAKDLETEVYGKLNPLHQIPVIDDDGIVLSESGAILLYLAKKHEKLMGSGANDEAQVLRWSFAAMNSLEMPTMNIQMIDWFKDDGAKRYRDLLVGWADRHLGNLEKWLDDREFIATDSFTVADILMVHVLEGIKDKSLLEKYLNVRAYRDYCLSRPSWPRTMDRYLKYVEIG